MQQTRTKEEKQELIQLYKQSGMSARAFIEEFNLNLATFRNWQLQFEKNKVVEAVAIDASLKEEIQNSKNLCILTYPQNDALAFHTSDAIVNLGDGKSEKGCDDSKVEPGHSENLCDDSEFKSRFLDEAKHKELIELLDDSKDYVFVFSY
jgi:hypothetical protein